MGYGKIEVEGLTLSYQHQGNSDKTIVMLHGNSACKQVFAKQFEFFNGSQFSLLAFDLPGHGNSDNAHLAETQYTIPGYAHIIDQALAALEVKNYIVLGWSLGGNIALEMAGCDLTKANTDFKGMMIFGAPPVGPGVENLEKAYLPATFESAVGDKTAPGDQIDSFVQTIYGTLKPVPEQFYKCAHRTEGKAREIMVNHWMAATSGHNQYNTASKWKKPICVIHGNLDPFAALDYLKETPWCNLWQNQILELPNCGHAPFIEDPRAFNSILDNFAANIL